MNTLAGRGEYRIGDSGPDGRHTFIRMRLFVVPGDPLLLLG